MSASTQHKTIDPGTGAIPWIPISAVSQPGAYVSKGAGDLIRIKIQMVGLPAEAGAKFPSELSGGMVKRAGLARALALDPEILFLDEPTAGLDPIAASAFDQLIRDLQRSLGLTVVMITHDLEEAIALGDRVVVLAAGPRSRVIDSFPVDLERPRDVAEIKLDPRFMDLYRNIWSSLRGEVEKSYERHD